MKSFLKKLFHNERGNTLIIAGAGLPMLMGFAGLANDTIQWSLWKRQLQRQADSAAIAGTYARFAGHDLNVAVTRDLAKNSRTGIAFASGYPVVTPLADTADHMNGVQVTLAVRQQLPFSQFFMSEAPLVIVNATAGGIEAGEYCAQANINTAETGISAGGTVDVDLGCGMITNSTSMDAAVAFGDSTVDADPVAAVGGIDSTDNWEPGTTLLPFTVPVQDPFADISPPPIPAGCNTDFRDNPSDNQTWPLAANLPASRIVCVDDWVGKGTVTLQPDTTYIITGSMLVNSGADMTCNRCTFILTNSDPADTGTVELRGGAKLNLTSPDSGPYTGILFYSNRGADPTDTNKINGGATSTFSGAFYFPHQKVEFAGNASVTYSCLKLVSWQLTFTGTASITNNCPPGYYGDRFRGRHIRLVA